jgi:small ubiquitin-related modifier
VHCAPLPLPRSPQYSIKIRDADGAEVVFKLKSTAKLGKVFDAYCQRKGLQPNAVKFVFDGANLDREKTIADSGIEDGDCIDAGAVMTGGC